MIDLSAPVDSAFTKALPKIEVKIYLQTINPHPSHFKLTTPPNTQVHAHLSGSISRQCLHEIWKRKKQADPNFPIEDPLVLMPPGKVDYTLQTFFQVFSKLIYQLCDDLESLTYATTSVLESFLNDGVRYLELRTIPRASPSSNITRETYLTTILDTIAAFPSKNKISVFLILALDRGNTSPTEALEIIDLAIANKARGVVGVDLCGNPTQGDVTIYRDAFARAKAHGLGVTLHFAETPASGDTDDVGFFCSPVSNEYLLAAEHFGVGRAEMLSMCEKSVEMIFGGEEEKQRLREIILQFKNQFF
ncbi:Adenosine deaminase-like protein [Penicillium subrubescens]|uniref:Adenosine deaminase-like protein n=1 Tax=Penicillium subrubescens TaxID=1316194 RepID=A0A1Q5U1Y6_9EURO|nr:Adenosine deaminase-like protein [Penicillium subrubescens]